MEVDFTQYYIIVQHHCEVTSLILTKHGEEHAQRVKKRFWDILSLQKERGPALNFVGGPSEYAQADVKKVLGYFVTNERMRYDDLGLKCLLVMAMIRFDRHGLNLLMNNDFPYRDVAIVNAGPV